MFENLSPDAIRVIMVAQEEARRLAGNVMGTEHILLGLLREGGRLQRVLQGLTYDQFLDRIQPDTSPPPASELIYDTQTRHALELAEDEAQRLGNQSVHPEHLLLGLLDLGEGRAVRYLEDSGFTLARLRWTALRLRRDEAATEVLTPVVDQFGQDITASLERWGSGLVGRDALVTSVIERLGGFGNRLPVFVSDSRPDALFAGVARFLVEGRIFNSFLAHRVVRLDAWQLRSQLVDGDSLRQTLLAILTETERAGDIILAFSDLPAFVADPRDEKGRVLADVIGGWLQSGKRTVMASADPAGWETLMERFVWRDLLVAATVHPASVPETIAILSAWQGPIGQHHQLEIDPAVLSWVAQNAKGPLPEAAIDLLDQLAARKAYRKTTGQIRLRELERTLRRLKEQRDLLASQPDLSAEAFQTLKSEAERCEEEIRRLHPLIPADGTAVSLSLTDVNHD